MTVASRSAGRAGGTLHFPPFQLNEVEQLLKRGDESIHLEPRAWEVLCFLARRPGEVVSKDEILTVLWPDAMVSEGALTRAIGLVRQALGDDARNPRFVETVHGRGFRFIAPIRNDGAVGQDQPASPSRAEAIFVGRTQELQQLDRCFGTARTGRHQLVMVEGAPGIGKTSLVQSFLAGRPATMGEERVRVVSGQCIQQHGAGEAYMPLLAAFGQLGRGSKGAELTAVLRKHAPSWLVQLPGLLSSEESDRIRAELAGTGRGRMLREIAAAIEALTADTMLVLVLEDLHWSDGATLDFLSTIASHPRGLRLLILGLYRPLDAAVGSESVRRSLADLQRCEAASTIRLNALGSQEIAQYCGQRFADSAFRDDAVSYLHSRTGGNPLFLGAMVDHLVARGWLEPIDGAWQLTASADLLGEIPDSIRQMIEMRLDALGEERRRLLEAASVAGVEFAAPVVTAALGGGDTKADAIDAEAACRDLAQDQHPLRYVEDRVWPDGTNAACYTFAHALYQQVLYDHVPRTRRARLHQRVGERLELAYGAKTSEVAAELAAHFQTSGDHARSVAYLWQAASGLGRRFAAGDVYLVPALDHLEFLPEGIERDYQELILRMNLGMGLFAREGFTAHGVEENLTRAEDLCDEIGGGNEITVALLGMWVCRMFAGHRDRSHGLVRKLEARAADRSTATQAIGAELAAAATHFFEGDFTTTAERLEAVPHEELRHWSGQEAQADAQIGFSGADPVVAFLGFASWNSWTTGYPEQARQYADEALVLAESCANPFTVGGIQFAAAMLGLFLRDREYVRPLARALLAKAVDQDFVSWRVGGEFLDGWVDLAEGDSAAVAARLRALLEGEVSSGVALGACGSLALSIMVDACVAGGELDEALAVVERALRPQPDRLRGHWDAELHRQKGDLVWQIDGAADPNGRAERAYREAIAIAREQAARMLELRAATSLGRWLVAQGRAAEAEASLTPIYAWFSEGHQTVDLQEAKALLAQLR